MSVPLPPAFLARLHTGQAVLCCLPSGAQEPAHVVSHGPGPVVTVWVIAGRAHRFTGWPSYRYGWFSVAIRLPRHHVFTASELGCETVADE